MLWLPSVRNVASAEMLAPSSRMIVILPGVSGPSGGPVNFAIAL
jgi:hypothetical protein